MADRPDLVLSRTLDEDYYAEWTSYLNDTFPLRAASIRANLRIDQDIFGSSSADVYEGEEGWLYLERSFSRPCEAPLTSEEAVAALGDVAAEIEQPLAVAIGPSKFRIVPEFLGDDGEDKSKCALDAGVELTDALAVADIDGYLDMWTVLSDLGSGEDLYYRTDTHWRDIGAMAMLEEIALELGLDWDALDVVSKGTIGWEGDLTRLQGTPASEDTERLVVERDRVEVKRLDDADYLAHRVVRYGATSTGEESLAPGETLVIHDSFFAPGNLEHVMASLAAYSEQTTYLHIDGLAHVDLVELIGSADRVVIEVVERIFAGRMQELVDAVIVTASSGG
ncbi:MAG: hypothetical protein IH940_12880 [Acidobacteria bacterium]|nr:hypothetical protein [Acidobacteriota bacterium]